MRAATFRTKQLLMIACATVGWGRAAAADGSSTLTIAQAAMQDLQQSNEVLATETRDLPMPGEVINLYNPASKLAPASVVSAAAAAAGSPAGILQVSGPTDGTGRAGSTFTSAGAASPSFVLPPPRSPITPGTSLPKDVTGYTGTDLNPSSWPSSQASSINGGQSAGFVQTAGGAIIHAAYWGTPTASSFVDLHPAGTKYSASHAFAVAGSQVVGFGTLSSGLDHAMVWTIAQGTNSVDLHPTGFRTSYAKATTGFLQVGYAYVSAFSGSQAMMWAGSATSVVNLNGLFFASEALGISDNSIAGDAEFFDAGGVELHAMVWDVTTHLPKDIHPTTLTFNDSRAVAISGTSIGGYGADTASGASHALYWSSANGASAVDMNPRGYFDSQITAVSSAIQVGFGHVSNDPDSLHALLWTGAAGTYLDLNQYLSSNYGGAVAEGIDTQGRVTGFALNKTTGSYDAVIWPPIAATPEPASIVSLSMLAGGWLIRRKRKPRGLTPSGSGTSSC